jgi:hypothetical protein
MKNPQRLECIGAGDLCVFLPFIFSGRQSILAKQIFCMEVTALIPCTDPCIYQQEGCCTLSRAVSSGRPAMGQGCIYFLPHSQQRRQRLPDVAHRDQL